MSKTGPVSHHDLFTREVRPLRNWHEWLERWHAAQSLEEMIGLLHVGMSVSLERAGHGEAEYNDVDRYLFYLRIADGWSDNDAMRIPEDGRNEYNYGRDQYRNQIRKTPGELRQMAALKAFSVLALSLFKFLLRRHDGGFERDWEKTIASERLFPAIQEFFRAEVARYSDRVKIRNLSNQEDRSHHEEQATAFLLNLFSFMWGWEEHEVYRDSRDREARERYNTEMRSRIDGAKPWMMEVLSHLGKLHLLRHTKLLLRLEDSCLEKLRETAMRSELRRYEHAVEKSRGVETLEEACYAGSPAGLLLREIENARFEHRRLTLISEAQQARDAAERRLQELSPQK